MVTVTLRTVKKATEGKILRGKPNQELTGISTDTRTLTPGDLFFAIQGERHDAHDFLPNAARLGAGAAVVHRKGAAQSVPDLPLVMVHDTTRALGDLAHWHRKQYPATVIAISGSNGKSTTKDMLFHILDGVLPTARSIQSYNNAIGVPLTLFQIRPTHVFAVVEMGTNSPGEIARLCEIADPVVGLLTNVSGTHLERLGSEEGVAREKSVLLRHTAWREGAFYNADDYWSREIAKKTKGTLSSFGIDNRAELRAFKPHSYASGISFKVRNGGPRIHIPIAGRYNAMNALAAIAVARKQGIDWTTICERLATFKLPSMRMELSTHSGVTIVNDAYNSNPVSLEAAAKTLHDMQCRGRRILVVADMLELGERSVEAHRSLGEIIAAFEFDYLLGIGPNTSELLSSAAERGMSEDELLLAGSKQELAQALLDLLEPGDVVLFKGSRSMKLEEVVEQVQTGLGAVDRREPEVPAFEPYLAAPVGEDDKRAAGAREGSPVGRMVG